MQQKALAIRKGTRRLIVCAISLTSVLGAPTLANDDDKPLPRCLAGVCVGEQAPTEAVLRTRFGGREFDLGYRTRGYCFELKTQTQTAHLLFSLKDFGDGWRVVSVRAATRPICARATPLEMPLQLRTGEGVGLGGTVESVHLAYGAATYRLDPKSRVVVEIMATDTLDVDSAIQYVPADPSLALSAVFVIAADRLVAIEVSSDI